MRTDRHFGVAFHSGPGGGNGHGIFIGRCGGWAFQAWSASTVRFLGPFSVRVAATHIPPGGEVRRDGMHFELAPV